MIYYALHQEVSFFVILEQNRNFNVTYLEITSRIIEENILDYFRCVKQGLVFLSGIVKLPKLPQLSIQVQVDRHGIEAMDP